MNLSFSNVSLTNILYFLYYKKSYHLYNDYSQKRTIYTPVNKYIMNKIMNK